MIENLEGEIWKPWPGYEGLYEVSNMGRARSLDRIVKGRWGCDFPKKGKLLTLKPNNHGYVVARIYKGDRVQSHSICIHRVVAKLFCENPNNYADIDHVGGNKFDNRASKLEWVTKSENSSRSYSLGRNRQFGEDRSWAVLRDRDIPIIRALEGVLSRVEIAATYGVCRGTIDCVIKRKTWTHIPERC